MSHLTPIAASVQCICRNWQLFTSGRASERDYTSLRYEVAVSCGRGFGGQR